MRALPGSCSGLPILRASLLAMFCWLIRIYICAGSCGDNLLCLNCIWLHWYLCCSANSSWPAKLMSVVTKCWAIGLLHSNPEHDVCDLRSVRLMAAHWHFIYSSVTCTAVVLLLVYSYLRGLGNVLELSHMRHMKDVKPHCQVGNESKLVYAQSQKRHSSCELTQSPLSTGFLHTGFAFVKD